MYFFIDIPNLQQNTVWNFWKTFSVESNIHYYIHLHDEQV